MNKSEDEEDDNLLWNEEIVIMYKMDDDLNRRGKLVQRDGCKHVLHRHHLPMLLGGGTVEAVFLENYGDYINKNMVYGTKPSRWVFPLRIVGELHKKVAAKSKIATAKFGKTTFQLIHKKWLVGVDDITRACEYEFIICSP